MPTFVQRKGPGGKRVWQALVRRRGYPQQTRTFDTKGEAEGWASTLESEMSRGVFVSRAEAEDTTLAEALNRYRTEIVPQKRMQTAKRGASTDSSIRSVPLPRAFWRASEKKTSCPL